MQKYLLGLFFLDPRVSVWVQILPETRSGTRNIQKIIAYIMYTWVTEYIFGISSIFLSFGFGFSGIISGFG